MKVIATRKYKAGYEVRTEAHLVGVDEQEVTIKSAYTPEGDYLGTPRIARLLIVKRRIKPEKADPMHHVCSIGFCEAEQKWYGWSHRAICGFGVDDTVEEGDCTNSSGFIEEYLRDHPEADLSLPVGFTARSLEDAKQMAVAFASSVS